MPYARPLHELTKRPEQMDLVMQGIPKNAHGLVADLYQGISSALWTVPSEESEELRAEAIHDLADHIHERLSSNKPRKGEAEGYAQAMRHIAARALHERDGEANLDAVNTLADLHEQGHAGAKEALEELTSHPDFDANRFADHLREEWNARLEDREPSHPTEPEQLKEFGKGNLEAVLNEFAFNPHASVREAAGKRIKSAGAEVIPYSDEIFSASGKPYPLSIKVKLNEMASQARKREERESITKIKKLWVPASKERGIAERKEALDSALNYYQVARSRGFRVNWYPHLMDVLSKYASEKSMLPALFKRARGPSESREELYKHLLEPLWSKGPQNATEEEYGRAIQLERELHKALVEQGKAKPRAPKRKLMKRPVKQNQGLKVVPVFEGSVIEKLNAIDVAARDGSNAHLPALLHALSDASSGISRRAIKHLINWRGSELDALLTKAAFHAGETPHGDALRFIQRIRRKRSKS